MLLSVLAKDMSRRFSLLLAAVFISGSLTLNPAQANELEKTDLTIGFIKLTDMAALAVAKELGYFEDEGLNVTLAAQPNWTTLLQLVIEGELDGAHMLPGQALDAYLNRPVEQHIVAPFSMDLNGNAITLSNELWSKIKGNVDNGPDGKPVHPITAHSLKPVADELSQDGKPLRLGMVYPVSTHNYELRYWLAAGDVHPGYYSGTDSDGQKEADVLISVAPPPQMPAKLAANEIDGYCVGEPWNQQALADQVGIPVITDYQIWENNPEKIFGLRKQFVEENPDTTLAILRALIKASHWLDENDDVNRGAVVAMISRPEYVDADPAVIGASMTGTFEFEPGDVRLQYDFNVFYRFFANYPFYSDAVWTLTQMRRWGQIEESQDDAWYGEVAQAVYRPDLFLEAAQQLVNAGVVSGADFPWDSDGYKPPTDAFIDGITFDGRKPNEYLQALKIGLK
jgi:nitrate/nitrite transport system substrate-binding protein